MRTSERLITFIPVIIFILSSTVIAYGIDFKIEPSITLGEEYNDNIFLREDNEVDDYITRVRPSFILHYKAPIWEWDVSYIFDYRYYAKEARDADTTHDLQANGHIEIIKEFFFIDITDEYARTSLDITRDFTRDSLFVNQSDRNMFSANPYFVLRPHSLITINVGYIFEDVWYKEEEGINRRNNIGHVDTVYEVSPMVTLNAHYKYTNADTDLVDYDKHDIGFGPRYEYAEESFIFFTIGNSWLDLKGVDSSSRIFYDAGVTHKFPTYTVSLVSALDYVEDPAGDLIRVNSYELSLDKTAERATLGTSIFFREFRDYINDGIDTRSYGISGNITYELTPKMTGIFDFTVEKIENELENTYTMRYLPTLEIDYMLLEDLTFTFRYHYIDSYSPEIEADNYKNNRAVIEVTKSF